jgi:hypothetical protein
MSEFCQFLKAGLEGLCTRNPLLHNNSKVCTKTPARLRCPSMRRLARHLFTLCSAVSLVSLGLVLLNAVGVSPSMDFRGNPNWWRLSVVSGHVWLGEYQGRLDHQPVRASHTLNLGAIILPTTVLAILCSWWCTRQDRRNAVPGLCPLCGYDLRVSPERCPECGTAATDAT